MMSAKQASESAVDWLPAERLGQVSIDARLRAWLIGKGLLTVRLKAACKGPFTLHVIDQWTGLLQSSHRQGLRTDDAAGLFRDVEMECGGQIWVFAQSIIPDSTLSAHPWLAELGDSALGETLCGLSGYERSAYEFGWLPAGLPVAARALRNVAVKPAGLWARRSRISLHGAPILVQELFLPAIHAQ
ncbi:MAG: chorismate--pyruvate lyase family protein [Steroidobacterales bacterium]